MNAIELHGLDVRLSTEPLKATLPIEHRSTIKIAEGSPKLRLCVDGQEVAAYEIRPTQENPNLIGQYLRLSVRVLETWAVMMDCVISKEDLPVEATPFSEGIRFQPILISASSSKNAELHGKGLFERGLNFAGHITPTSVRHSCICDECHGTFTLKSFHTRSADNQAYFYSKDGLKTLILSYYEFPEMPQADASREEWKKFDVMLSERDRQHRGFSYFNPLRCPRCGAPFIDFEKFPELHRTEYYASCFLDEKIASL